MGWVAAGLGSIAAFRVKTAPSRTAIEPVVHKQYSKARRCSCIGSQATPLDFAGSGMGLPAKLERRSMGRSTRLIMV